VVSTFEAVHIAALNHNLPSRPERLSLLLLLGLFSRLSLPDLGSGDFERLLRRSLEWPWSRLRLRLRRSRSNGTSNTIPYASGRDDFSSRYRRVISRSSRPAKVDRDASRFGPRVILFDQESFSRETDCELRRGCI
jgi:hypothetical protein